MLIDEVADSHAILVQALTCEVGSRAVRNARSV